ncbi:TPA: hypothetical protein ACH3X1_010504 [Trebouxia sp. C0004]
MQPSSSSKRAAALRDLKRKPVPHQGPPRFSAATSHEHNDAYMQEFDTAYAELEAMSLAQKGSAQGISAHRPHATVGIPHRASSTARPATTKSTVSQPAQPMQSAYPAHINSSWRSGPEDPAGRICNVSDVPLMCSSINWSAGEVVVGSADHALYVVDVQTGKKRRTLYTKTAGHAEWVTTCQYLPDGRIISGGMDSLLCLWEANSNKCQQLTAHAAPISVVDISPGTNTAVSASYDKSVRVWDVTSRRASESSCLTGHAAPVLQLVCGNGDNLISGDRGGTVIMWGLTTGSTTSELKDAHAGHVTALAWQHDTNGCCMDTFFSGGQDGHLKMWDPRSNKCVHDVAAHVNARGKGAVGNIVSAGAASSNLVVTAAADNTVKAFDARADLQPVSEAKLSDFPYSMVVAGGLALCGCGDGSLHVIDISSGQTLYALGANKHAVRGVHVSEKRLVCMGDDGSVFLCDFML